MVVSILPKSDAFPNDVASGASHVSRRLVKLGGETNLVGNGIKASPNMRIHLGKKSVALGTKLGFQ